MKKIHYFWHLVDDDIAWQLHLFSSRLYKRQLLSIRKGMTLEQVTDVLGFTLLTGLLMTKGRSGSFGSSYFPVGL